MLSAGDNPHDIGYGGPYDGGKIGVIVSANNGGDDGGDGGKDNGGDDAATLSITNDADGGIPLHSVLQMDQAMMADCHHVNSSAKVDIV